MELLIDKSSHTMIGDFEICGLEMWAQVNIDKFNHYEVSTMGRVMGKTGKLLKFYVNDGYNKVTLCNNTYRKTWLVHRIVAKTFIHNSDPEDKDQVNHVNGVKDDNRIENLEWVNQWENNKHAYQTGLANEQFRRSSNLYNDEEWLHKVYLRLKSGEKVTDLAKELEVNYTNLGNYLRNTYGRKHLAEIYRSDAHTSIPKRTIQEAYELALLGRPFIEISHIFGVSSYLRVKMCEVYGKEHIDHVFKEIARKNRTKLENRQNIN